MKKFTDIRRINEDCVGSYATTSGPHSPVPIDGPEASTFDISHPESIQRLNGYLQSTNNKPCIDPNYVLNNIQKKLMIMGLYFYYGKKRPYVIQKPTKTNQVSVPFRPGNDEESVYRIEINQEDFPLSYMGGRQGVLDNNHTIGKDDGIYHRIGKRLKLRVTYSMADSGLLYVQAKIIMVD